MKASKTLPMEDLKLFGLYRNGKFAIPEEQVMALKSGRMTDVIELRDLKSKERDIHIERLPARLSIVKGDDGKPALRIDPVYTEANNHPLLNDLERTRLVREEIANIKKDYLDQQDNVQSRVIEYDKGTKQFVSFDPNKVKAPLAVDGESLTLEKRRKYREGELIELADGTQLQIRASDRRRIRSNRAGLVLSVLVDGGISYLLVRGIRRLIGKKSAEQQSYSEGYVDAVKEVKKQMQRRLDRNAKDRYAVRELNDAKRELSRITSPSADVARPTEVKSYDDAKKSTSMDTDERTGLSKENEDGKGRRV